MGGPDSVQDVEFAAKVGDSGTRNIVGRNFVWYEDGSQNGNLIVASGRRRFLCMIR
jgi:hypothetical protein